MDERPLCIDLFCGYGGWARGFRNSGYRVVGFDIQTKCRSKYEGNGGEFVLADVRNLDGRGIMARFGHPRVVVASPPCAGYSWYALPPSWQNRRKAPLEDGILWCEAERLIRELSPAYWCIENVRGAGYVHGAPTMKVGSRYLWGDFPIMNPEPVWGKWRTSPSPDRAERRAQVPYPLARALAEACLP